MGVKKKVTDIHILQADIKEYLRYKIGMTKYPSVCSFIDKKFKEYRIKHGSE